ncbi:MAG: methylenetetrahydrofolate reductase [NAD(P)H] [bacterium]
MHLDKIYKNLNEQIVAKQYISQKPVISLEVFPPKNDFEANSQKLIAELAILKQFQPAFVSVTYGAGGSNQENSFELALKIKKELDIDVMPHFTCIGASKENVKKYLELIKANKINSILALRGDIPQNCPDFEFNEDFRYANDLVEFIKSETNLSIGVAGYPECHRECCSLEEDIKNLKKKVDAGASAVITQVFFDNDYYFRFVEKAQLEGIDVPIIPGILPITNINQIERMTAMCGTNIPESLVNRMKENQNDPNAISELGIEFAIYQCQQLSDAKVPGIHFYTLNKAFAVKEILENIL